jgi:hypothetical protein
VKTLKRMNAMRKASLDIITSFFISLPEIVQDKGDNFSYLSFARLATCFVIVLLLIIIVIQIDIKICFQCQYPQMRESKETLAKNGSTKKTWMT